MSDSPTLWYDGDVCGQDHPARIGVYMPGQERGTLQYRCRQGSMECRQDLMGWGEALHSIDILLDDA